MITQKVTVTLKAGQRQYEHQEIKGLLLTLCDQLDYSPKVSEKLLFDINGNRNGIILKVKIEI
jgi:hypothetical protein